MFMIVYPYTNSLIIFSNHANGATLYTLFYIEVEHFYTVFRYITTRETYNIKINLRNILMLLQVIDSLFATF